MHDPAAAPPSPDFRTLFESGPGLYLVLDPDFVVVAVSEAYARATQARREDIVGKSVYEAFPDDDAASLRASLQRVKDTMQADAMPLRTYGVRTPEDSIEHCWRPVNSPVADGAGKLAYIIQRLDDVAELLRLEAESDARLKSANAALERSIDEAQRFAYLAAHDLQSPLNAIAGCVRLLSEECEGKLSEQGEKFIGYVLEYTERAQTLIRDLLAYSRLQSGAQAFEPTWMAKAFNEALDAVASRVAATGAHVTCGELPTLCVDRNQITQLLSHLIDNAIKFNRTERPEVQVAAELRGDKWLFSVRDNGIGIEPRFHEEIFEIFRRLHSAQAYSGSGIGLAMCQRIVDRHGGRIWVESQEGKGSTFLFTLPAANPV